MWMLVNHTMNWQIGILFLQVTICAKTALTLLPLMPHILRIGCNKAEEGWKTKQQHGQNM